MRLKIILFISVTILMVVGVYAAEGEVEKLSQLDAQESMRFERIKHLPGVREAKIVMLDDVLLLSNNFPVVDFEGKKTFFKIAKEDGEQVWKGSGENNFNRIVVRNINGKYSGHIFISGKTFVLAPIKQGISVLYEKKGSDKCGIVAFEGGR